MTYKLVYFPVKGRVQALRYMCIDNDIKFEEEVFPIDYEKWPAKKATCELGTLPIVFDGNFEVGQSNAILRHLARKHGLYGKDDHERAQIDMVNDQQADYREAYYKMIYQDYDNGKQKFIDELPQKLAILEKLLGKNNGGKNYFVGTKQSFCDYSTFDLLDIFLVLSTTCLDQFPLLKSFHARMASKPKILKHRQSDYFKSLPINANGKQ